MSRAFGTRSLLLSTLLTWSCATRGPSPQVAADIGRADALVRDGCYRCLEEAHAIYERAAASRRVPGAAARGAFEAALLLAIRCKELGLPSDASFERARTWARRLPPAAVSALEPSVLVDAAELVIGELSGFDPEERQRRARAIRPEMRADNPHRRALDPLLDTSLAAAYLALSIDCERVPRQPPINGNDVLARHAGPPLMRYRLAMCGIAGVPPLGTLRETDPRWVDTLFFEGRREIESRAGDPAKAAMLLAGAREAFPASHAIILALARAQQALGEYEAALASVDSVIADAPAHRDALLARVENLSYLNRHDEAIATASRMIELGTWHLGNAYYWRAWNEHYLRQLDAAWNDVERAITLQSNTSVYTLAGFIAHSRKALDTAVDRFDRAFEIDGTNCIAVFSAGMVHVEQQAWPPASTKFSESMTCYTADASAARAELGRIEASTHAPERKARLAAAEQKRAASSEHLASQSAFNAAQCYLRLGQKQPALAHVDAAAAHPLMREKATALKVVIEKMR
jgi:tetratricopeptide (TPR) repeat protein